MRVKYKSTYPDSGESAAVFLFSDKGFDPAKEPALAFAADIISPLLKNKEFTASPLAALPLKRGAGWLFLVGLGPKAKAGPADIFEAAAKAAQMAGERGLKKLNIALPSAGNMAPAEILEQAAVGALLAAAPRLSFKKAEAAPSLGEITLCGGQIKNGGDIVKKAEITAGAVSLSRRLGETPPNMLYPQAFAAEAGKLAAANKLKIEVLDEKALAKAKCNLILAVGAGSARPPRLVKLSWQGGKKNSPPIVLVGKGITFDSGGMSLKPSGSLDGMKTDMSGAATVLAVTLAAAEMKLPINLTAIMPLAENMPDGGGFRVGDVVAGRSGRTVEITNTDAEGRLVLADALTLAGELKPALVIDVATLTGACVVALGDRCAGLFCENQKLNGALAAAAEACGELFWPMPLFSSYEDLLKSEIADTISANITAKGGGAICAALFLKGFAPESAPWAHLDIAGPARAGRARPGIPSGATGFGVRTLLKCLAGKALA